MVEFNPDGHSAAIHTGKLLLSALWYRNQSNAYYLESGGIGDVYNAIPSWHLDVVHMDWHSVGDNVSAINLLNIRK